jgi:hypothetical protein
MWIGETVVVYLNPDDPATNSLSEYRVKAADDQQYMIVFGVASAIVAAILTRTWANEKSGTDSGTSDPPA